ncbi:MAG: hypothetical protein J2P57_22380 [Acidimicrobiaceae bacterium]|nr:hypothetical protein [Acidimicrobiaceae bacterium]
MTTTDYLLDIALLAIVFLQIRGRRLTLRSLLLPIGVMVYAATQYLHGIPTAGNDLLLIVPVAGVGLALGVFTGIFTSVRPDEDGSPFAKAGFVAAVLWLVGVGTRFAFQLYASHGGASAIASFSAHHSITSANAWVAALILMAFGEVVGRTAVLGVRGWSISPEAFLQGRRQRAW